jgi:hypothetical protein
MIRKAALYVIDKCKKEDEQKVKEFVASAGMKGKEFV